MDKKNKIIHVLRKRILYLLVLVAGVALAVAGWIVSERQPQLASRLYEVAFGLLSGALVAFTSSLVISASVEQKRDGDGVAGLINSIGRDLDCANKRCATKDCAKKDCSNAACDKKDCARSNKMQVVRGHEVDGHIDRLIKSATRRIYILGANLNGTMNSYGKAIERRALENKELEVKIIASHRDNVFVLTRYHDIPGQTFESMREQLERTNKNIVAMQKEVKEQYAEAKFDVRFSLLQPTVLLIIIDDKVIVSHIVSGLSSSNSTRIICDSYKSVFNPHEQAFETVDCEFLKQFNETWDRALSVEESEKINAGEQFVSLNGGRLYSYKVKRRGNPAGRFFIKTKRKIADVCKLIWERIRTFILPFFMIAASAAGLIALGQIEEGTVLFADNVESSLLGIIAGAMLSIGEYISEKVGSKSELKETAEADSLREDAITQAINKSVFRLRSDEFPKYGIEVFDSRDAANIADRIKNAKRRVWIYATNHSYVKGLDVVDAVKGNTALDVRFLMLDPHSLFVDTRYADVKNMQDAQAFANEIGVNLKALFKEYAGVKHVKIKTYLRQPTFIMYLIDDTLILSHILLMNKEEGVSFNGQARRNIHIAFDMHYPLVKNFAMDYVNHFETVWREGRKSKPKEVKQNAARKKFYTIENEQKITLISQPAE